MDSLSIEPNKVFAWPKDQCLRATERVMIVFPPQLVKDDEVIGTVLEFSDDDTKIEYTYSNDMKQIQGLRIDLDQGQSLRIRKSTQALVPSNLDKHVIFEKID